ncbi:hypothetical protein [Dechloromonas hortensis]|uniref:hypothetical protein n=1 Tax=Dechloromonas hortensis TaxID=337779 RepID=UPI0012919190|nr:hypothetical protein [Dechloromonas hortensis]
MACAKFGQKVAAACKLLCHYSKNSVMPQLKNLPSGPYTLTDLILVWSMILVVFVGFWLLNRYLKRAPKKPPYETSDGSFAKTK